MSYDNWPTDEHARWIAAGNAFGRALMEYARDYAVARVPKDTPPESRAVAQRAAEDAVYGMMMMLDGVATGDVGDGHSLLLRLLAQVIDAKGHVKETIELAPDGDGLCMAFHAWKEGDFGKD